MREFFDSLSLSGAIILLLFVLVVVGVAMDWSGHANGEKVWSTFGSALTAFVSGRKLADLERKDG